MSTKLDVHEWAAILTIACVTGLLGVIALIDHEPPKFSLDAAQKMAAQVVFARVEGAVQYPGEYELPKGATVADLLKLAKPTSFADLRRVRTDTPLRNGRHLTIKQLPVITIFLDGAITSPGYAKVPKGTPFGQLHRFVLLEPEADIDGFDPTLILKAGDRVSIPYKNASSLSSEIITSNM